MKIVKESVKLEWITPDAAKVIERAGRTCYKSEEKITEESAAKFVGMVTRLGHHSVIEHAAASFRIVCDRGISHEIVRHRLASYSQESTRYCKYGDGIKVICPPGLEGESLIEWEKACRCAEECYLKMLDCGERSETGRSVLPTCLATELVMTANFREWMHFIKLRASAKAHPQIRIIARKVWNILKEECPAVFGNLNI